MPEFPRTWIIRRGFDTGKVLIQWAHHCPLMLIDADGTLVERYRFPPPDVLAATVLHVTDPKAEGQAATNPESRQ